jgi:hypothetical protein
VTSTDARECPSTHSALAMSRARVIAGARRRVPSLVVASSR